MKVQSVLLTIDKHQGDRGLALRQLVKLCLPACSARATYGAVLHFVAMGHLRVVKMLDQTDAVEFTDLGRAEVVRQELTEGQRIAAILNCPG